MKPLLPALKEKKRYIVFEVITEKFDRNRAQSILESECLKFLGEFGIAKSGFSIITDCWEKNKGIIKANPKYVNEVKMALSLVKGNLIFNVIGVSGTLNKAKQKFIKKEEIKNATR